MSELKILYLAVMCFIFSIAFSKMIWYVVGSRFCDLCSRMDKDFPTLEQNAETPEGVKDKKLNIFLPKSSYIMFNIKDILFICCLTIHIP